MADNPFDPKYPLGSLLGMLSTRPTTSEPDSPLARAFGLASSPATTFLGGAASDLFPPSKPTVPANPFANLAAVSDLFGPTPSTSLGSIYTPPKPVNPAIKRKAFFSFHYDDIMRVNVVRNAWKIDHPDNVFVRSFYDSSLWESRKLEGDDAVKRLIREGVEFTSAVCVLIGTETWLRRWVRYEIARAIVDGRGLLGVHLNSIRHHQTKTPHTRGHNPFEFLAIGKVQAAILSTPRYYLFEKQAMPNGIGGYEWAWNRYSDYTSPVTLPPWLADPVTVTGISEAGSTKRHRARDANQEAGLWVRKCQNCKMR
jgi:hypothetical protein